MQFKRVNCVGPRMYYCPQCNSVGPFRHYNAVAATPEHGASPDRWICKWCGFFWSPAMGRQQCVVGEDSYTAVSWGAKNGKPMPMQRAMAGEPLGIGEVVSAMLWASA